MLIANSKMKEFISDIDLSSIELKNYYSVSKKENADREKYFIINKEIDCSLCSVSASGLELTLYEYKENEIYLSNSRKLEDILNLSLKIFLSIKKILEDNYSDTIFDIILSIDFENEKTAPCSFISFYAVRDNFRIIDLKDIDNFKSDAVLIETVNK